MNPANTPTQIATDALASLLLGCLGAWLFMHIHLPPETLKIHEPGFLDILAGKGAAPDQYRLLQNHLIGLLYRVTDLYHAVFWFTAVSLAGAILLLVDYTYTGISRAAKRYLSIALALIYPVLMYNGPRGDTAFILLLALGLAMAIEREEQPPFLILIALMAFTRADVALFAALFAVLWKPAWFGHVHWILVVTLPLAVQSALQFIVFPEARYYCDVVMLQENLKLDRFAATPAFLLAGALLCMFHRSVIDFCRWLYHLGLRGKLLMLIFASYVVAILVVAIAAETRLFLPLVPFLLLLVQASRTDPA